jgi:alpha-1,2-mannosyltransferase
LHGIPLFVKDIPAAICLNRFCIPVCHIREDVLQIAHMRTWWTSRSRWEQAAIIVWAVVLLVVSVRVAGWPTSRTVYPIFSGSAQLWWSESDLYEPHRPLTVQGGYRYSPTFAILLTPFAYFPDTVGGVLWRLIGVAAFLGSLAWLARRVLPWPLSRDQFAWLTLLCVPLALQSVNNGQANVIVTAAMVAAVCACKEQRWNLASALLTLAFVCKVYPIALGMLLVVLYPRQLSWRLPLALVASLLVPFLLQDPSYVNDQYGKWIALLRADDRSAFPLADKHRDLWLLIEVYGIPLSRRIYTLLQIGGGLGIAVLCWRRQRQGWPEKALLTATLGLAVAWMMVLGPVVESSTFLLLAPSLAASIVGALQDRKWHWRTLLLAGSGSLFLAAVLLGGVANTARLHVVGIHPLASLLYFVYLLTESRPCDREAQQLPIERRAAA